MARIGRNARGEVTSAEVRVQGRYAKLIAGEIKVEDLDDEELARGRLKDRNGKFTGRPPNALPRTVVEAMMKELLKRGQEKFAESYLEAIEILGNIARDPDIDSGARIKAANLIIERIGGKVPDKVEFRAADPWQQIIDEIIVEDESKSAKKEKEKA